MCRNIFNFQKIINHFSANKNNTNKQIPIKITNAEALIKNTNIFSNPSLPNNKIIIIIIKRIITIVI